MSRALALLALLLACSEPREEWPEVPLGPERVSVMTFNVENLFDAQDDPGKEDHTYLPAARKKTAAHRELCERIPRKPWREECLHWDWSEEAVGAKIARVAAAVLQIADGRGPDVVVLQEVENLAVLERLRREGLKAAGYRPAVLIEGDDARGIDVGVLTRLKPGGTPRLHKIPFEHMTPAQLRDSRGILEVPLLLPDGTPLTVFAVHLPAPFHPREFREQALSHLAGLKRALPAGTLALAAGDFNVPYEEDAKHRVWRRLAEPEWLVAHRIGCGDCRGTSYYPPQDSWSFLDTVLLSRGLHPAGDAPWVVLPESVRVADAAPEQRTERGTPWSFEPGSKRGTSDHWPLVVELARRAR